MPSHYHQSLDVGYCTLFILYRPRLNSIVGVSLLPNHCGLLTRSSPMRTFQYPCYSKSWEKIMFQSSSDLQVFCMFLIKDHAHITDIAYNPFYKEAYLFRPAFSVCYKQSLNIVITLQQLLEICLTGYSYIFSVYFTGRCYNVLSS